MAVNQLESNLEAITRTIAILENSQNPDLNKLNELKDERNKILKDLKVI